MLKGIRDLWDDYKKGEKIQSIQKRLMDGTFGLSQKAMREKLTMLDFVVFFQKFLIESEGIEEFSIFSLEDAQSYDHARNFMYRTGNTIVELEYQEDANFYNLRKGVLSYLDNDEILKTQRYQIKSLWAFVIMGLIFDSIEKKGESPMDGTNLVSYHEYIPLFSHAIVENGGSENNVFYALFEPKSNLEI